MRTAVRTVLFAVGLAIFGVRVGVACAPAQMGATAAESAYTGELLRCVDDAKTLAESRACREKVDAKWGVTETVRKDGGR